VPGFRIMKTRDPKEPRDTSRDIVTVKNLAMLWAASAALPFFVYPVDGWNVYNNFAVIFLLFFVFLSVNETMRARREELGMGTTLYAWIPLLLFAAASLIYWMRRLGA